MVSVERQIAHSHHVLINKRDLIDEEKLAVIVEKIRTINPQVGITPVTYAKVDFEDLELKYYHIKDEETTNRVDNKPKNTVIRFTHEPSKDQLERFLNMTGSHFFRIKGFVELDGKWYKVDAVNEKYDIVPYTVAEGDLGKEGWNELVCLSSKGLASISHLAKTAAEELTGIYTIEM